MRQKAALRLNMSGATMTHRPEIQHDDDALGEVPQEADIVLSWVSWALRGGSRDLKYVVIKFGHYYSSSPEDGD